MHPDSKPKGILYLIPSSLGEEKLADVWPGGHVEIINRIDEFIVENVRTTRRFLKRAGYCRSFDKTVFHLLNKHTPEAEKAGFLRSAVSGNPIGLLSEAGCPCIADPGQLVVQQAHEMEIAVKPLVGPSSILLALMASGMNGQEFRFHAYLPIQKPQRIKKIREMEKESRASGATQLFMETPFRNQALLEDLLTHCIPSTRLCLAAELTTAREYIRTMAIQKWRTTRVPSLHKRPAIFLLQA